MVRSFLVFSSFTRRLSILFWFYTNVYQTIGKSFPHQHDIPDFLFQKEMGVNFGGTWTRFLILLIQEHIFELKWSKQTRTQCPHFQPFYFQPCKKGLQTCCCALSSLLCHQIGANCCLTICMEWRWNLQLSIHLVNHLVTRVSKYKLVKCVLWMEDTLLFQPRHMIMVTPCFDPVTFVYGAVPQVMTEIRLTFLRPLTVCSHTRNGCSQLVLLWHKHRCCLFLSSSWTCRKVSSSLIYRGKSV